MWINDNGLYKRDNGQNIFQGCAKVGEKTSCISYIIVKSRGFFLSLGHNLKHVGINTT